jgi:hypothetical protein
LRPRDCAHVPGSRDERLVGRERSRERVGLAPAFAVILLLVSVVARESEGLVEPIVVAGQRLDDGRSPIRWCQ